MTINWTPLPIGDGDLQTATYAAFNAVEAPTEAALLQGLMVGGHFTIGTGFDMVTGDNTVRAAIMAQVGIYQDFLPRNQGNVVAPDPKKDPGAATEYGFAQQLLSNFRTGVTGAQLNAIMAARALAWNQDPVYQAWMKSKGYTTAPRDKFELTDAEARAAFDAVWPTDYRAQLLHRLGIGAGTSFDGSTEQVATGLLVWNGGSGILGNAIKRDIDAGNRAEAWYELRYNSNAGASRSIGIAKARFMESSLFGLYDAGNVSYDEATNIFQTVTRHRDTIYKTELQFGIMPDGRTATSPDSHGRDAVRSSNDDYSKTMAPYLEDGRIDTLDQALGQGTHQGAKTALLLGLQNQYATYKGALSEDAFDAANIYVAESAKAGGAGTFIATGIYQTGSFEKGANDLLLGMAGADILEGFAGNDVLIGADGNDSLWGGTGSDLLIGGNGDDSVGGDDGDDTMDGGAGHDSYVIAQIDGVQHDKIVDSDHDGVIVLTDNEGDLVNVAILQQQAPGVETWVDASFGSRSGVQLTHAGSWILTLGDGTTLDFGADFDPAGFGLTLKSAAQAGVANAWFNRASPADFGFGATLTGDFKKKVGTDNKTYVMAPPYGYASDGPQVDAPDAFNGTAGNEKVLPGGGNDVVASGDGSDYVDGGDGSDILYAGSGSDTMLGGAGDDMILSSVSGSVGLPARTDYQLPPVSPGATLLYSGFGWIVESVQNGQFTTVQYLGYAGASLTESTSDAGDVVDAGDGNDNVWGSRASDEIRLGAGDDYANGQGGADYVDGGEGSDYILGDGWNSQSITAVTDDQHGNDTLNGGAGDDLIRGQGRNDILFGGTGSDTLEGDSEQTDELYLAPAFHGHDILNGGDGDDVLSGDGLSDTLDGGSGNDWMHGDAADTLLGAQFHGGDLMEGGLGNDVLLGDGGNDLLDGGDGNDWLAGEDQTSVSAATRLVGDDALDGGAGVDTLIGGVGNDDLDGGGDNDLLLGGDGADTILGGAGNDWLSGEDELDARNVSAYTGDDSLEGGDGSDTLLGGNGSDFLDAGDGYNLLWGGAGADTLVAGGDNDWLSGGTQINSADAGINSGDDSLAGGEGNDTLLGGDGNDTLDGGEGADWIDGGLGDDTYAFDAPSEDVDDEDAPARIAHPAPSAIERYLNGLGAVASPQGAALGATAAQLQASPAADHLAGSHAAWNHPGNGASDPATGAGAGDTSAAGVLARGVGSEGDAIVLNDTVVGDTDFIDDTDGRNTYRIDEQLASAKTDSTGNLLLSLGGADSGRYLFLQNAFFTKDARFDFVDGSVSVRDWVQDNVFVSLSLYLDTTNQSLGTNFKYAFGAGGADWIVGQGIGGDTLDGGAGDDVIFGHNNDLLIGGTGHDLLRIQGSNITYQYNRGDGADEVQIALGTTANDTLALGAGITPADLWLSWSGTQLSVHVGPAGDYIAFDGEVGSDGSLLATGPLQNITFADGTHWTLSQLASAPQLGTDGGDSLQTFNVSGNLQGGASDDSLSGKAGNDTLDGGTGNDWMSGGDGDDIIYVDSNGDNALGGAGNDTVYSSAPDATVSHPDVEHYILTGTADIGIHEWNAGGGVNFAGNSGNNRMIGGINSDTLTGGAGNDTLDAMGAVVVQSVVSNDYLDGGTGDDTYIISNLTGWDTIAGGADSNPGKLNVLKLGAALPWYAWNIHRVTDVQEGGSNTDAIEIDVGGASTGILVNGFFDGGSTSNANNPLQEIDFADGTVWNLAQIAAHVQTPINGTASADTLTAGAAAALMTGQAGNDKLTGGAGADWLDGGAGSDTLAGGAGDDIYVVDATTDVVTEAAGGGNDAVRTSVTLTVLPAQVETIVLTGTAGIGATGNELANTIVGNDGDNRLNGGAGNDTIYSGMGRDTIDAGDGNDLVQVPQDNNEAWNTSTYDSIRGGAGNDTLYGGAGIDTLDGGTGDDLMIGGSTADIYYVDSSADVIVEVANGLDDGRDSDQVYSTASFILPIHVENLTLNGTASINGTGTAFTNILVGNAGNNVLSSGDGNDTLDGGAGADTLIGGIGSDQYTVDSASDVVIEGDSSNAGRDSVYSAVSFTLGDNLEYLRLTGTGNSTGTGNQLDNSIYGTSGSNVLTGNEGNDTLSGAGGADTLVGGIGDDTYDLSAGGTVVVTENSGEGVDTVIVNTAIVLAAALENVQAYWNAGVIEGNASDNVMTSAGLNNMIGDGGNDTFVDTDFSGGDTLVGGLGDDVYRVGENAQRETFVENAGEGIDTIIVDDTGDIDFTLPDNIENLVTSTYGDGTGNALDNVITTGPGGGHGNKLSGLDGNDTLSDTSIGFWDTLIGGRGNDVYDLGVDSGDIIVENAGEGSDTVVTSVSQSTALAANVENLTLIGAASSGIGNEMANVLLGNALANTLSAGLGNDTLDGGSGDDTLAGGAGDDTYDVDSAADVVQENANEGVDNVVSTAATFTLSANVENLNLSGSAAAGTGNDGANLIVGNALANTLDGGAGADTLRGGAGNDTYIVDDVNDSVVESSGEGTDTEVASVSVTAAANVENVTLGGTTAINATGNARANLIVGNAATNVIDGGAGVDTMKGGAGDDAYVVDTTTDSIVENAGEGTDSVSASVSYTLSANVENLTLTGSSTINGTGNGRANVLTGNSAANSLQGGAGDDLYVIDAADTVLENANEGNDTIQVAATWSLVGTPNVENLTLAGTGAFNATGNDAANVLTGNASANVLTGGKGNDTYYAGAGDTIVENGGEGTDLVVASANWALAATPNVENLTLASVAASGTGNGAANLLTGNALANTLDGGAGIDTLVGGAGDDLYIVDNAADVVTEIAGDGTDTVNASTTYALANNVENLTLTGSTAIDGTGNSGNNVLTGNAAANVLTGGAGDDTYVIDASDTVTEASGAGTDTVVTGTTYTLGANLENLTISGAAAANGRGNALDNAFLGNAAANVFTGLTGNDTYTVGAGDGIVEASGEGTDTALATATYTLDANVENLTLLDAGGAIDGNGNGLANILTGNGAANVLSGGAGDDIYIVGTGDSVVEAASAGIDTVQSSASCTLSANVENLTLTGNSAINGTGNDLANVLSGNSAANRLAGGKGADTYVVGAGDTVVEQSGQGNDTVQSSVTFTLSVNVENLQLTGTASIDGVGNAQANLLKGNAGDNFLDGQAGADTLNGGAGNDIYAVDQAGDLITEAAGGGVDTVLASVDWTLGSNIENLILQEGSIANATGNALNNVLTGNSLGNSLSGAGGNDTLIGGAGADTIRFGRGAGVDTVVQGDGAEGLTDVVLFTAGDDVNLSDVAFARSGDDLHMHLGADDLVFQQWFDGSQFHVGKFQFSDGTTLADYDVNQLIGAMAVFGAGSPDHTIPGGSATHELHRRGFELTPEPQWRQTHAQNIA